MTIMISFNCKSFDMRKEIMGYLENIYGRGISFIDKGVICSSVVKTKDSGLLKKFKEARDFFISNSKVTDFVVFEVKN